MLSAPVGHAFSICPVSWWVVQSSKCAQFMNKWMVWTGRTCLQRWGFCRLPTKRLSPSIRETSLSWHVKPGESPSLHHLFAVHNVSIITALVFLQQSYQPYQPTGVGHHLQEEASSFRGTLRLFGAFLDPQVLPVTPWHPRNIRRGFHTNSHLNSCRSDKAAARTLGLSPSKTWLDLSAPLLLVDRPPYKPYMNLLLLIKGWFMV